MSIIGCNAFHVMLTVFNVESAGFSGKVFFSFIIGYGRFFVPIIYRFPSTDVSRKASLLSVSGNLHDVLNVAVVENTFWLFS